MKNLKRLTAGTLLAGLVFTSCQNDKVESDVVESIVSPIEIEGEVIKGSYIIMLDNKVIKPTSELLSNKSFTDRDSKSKASRELATETVKKINATLSSTDFDQNKVASYYTTQFAGISVENLSDEELIALSKNSAVASIHYDQVVPNPMDDVIVEGDDTKSFSTKMAQQTPCGISRAGGFVNSAQAKTWIWVIDTGIDLDHPDLNVVTDSRYARSFVGGSPDDCNGHGTHVAGSAAAVNNNTGVVGVSAGAPVVPIRVFGCSGGASSSAILNAINHVGANDIPGDVINMSLGGFVGSRCASTSPYRSALLSIGNANTRIALAAGNSARNASNDSPACINGNNIYTVASMTCSQSFSSFSNYGRATVDVIATGSSVLSTWPGGGYRTISGTSMASPHVAGILHARNGAPLGRGSVTSRGESYPIGVVK